MRSGQHSRNRVRRLSLAAACQTLESRLLLSDSAFADGFESPELDPFWQTSAVSGYFPFPSSAQQHSGGQSAELTTTQTDEDKYVELSHAFDTPVYGRFSVWMYDTAANYFYCNYFQFAVTNATDNNTLSIVAPDLNFGVGEGGSYQYYSPDTGTVDTLIPRTKDWHQFVLTTTPDSASIEIDGAVVCSLPSGFPVNNVAMTVSGVSWRPAMTAYFDDFSFEPYLADGPDTYIIAADDAGSGIQVWHNSSTTSPPAQTWPAGSLTTLNMLGRSGDDTLILDLARGIPALTDGLTFDGGEGFDRLKLAHLSSVNDVQADGATIRIGSLIVTHTAVESVSLAPDSTLPISLGSLALSGNSLLSIDGQAMLQMGSLSLTGQGTLDIGDNDIILTNPSGPHGAHTVEQLRAWLRSALIGGGEANPWTGTGLTSTTARDNENMDTAIAIFNNDDGEGGAWMDSYGDTPLTASSILLKYTYFGDANADGTITADDFAAATAGWFDQMSAIAPTWMTGDFDYDKKVTADDFAMVTASWFSQDRAHPLTASPTPTPLEIPGTPPLRDGKRVAASGSSMLTMALSPATPIRKPDPNILLFSELAIFD